MKHTSKTGLFFCRCGPNIGSIVDLDGLADPSLWPSVPIVGTHPTLCSEEGKAWLAEHIEHHGIDRAVIVGCSPREHEATFQRVLSEAGLNPYMLQMVNIREQCEWVAESSAEATAKALALVKAGLSRVRFHEGIAPSEIDCSPDVLVIGAGVAGLSAALTLSQKGRKVYLIEKTFVLGGRVYLLDEAYPGMECASCFLEPALAQVMHDERVKVLTGAEVKDVVGSYGNFTVTVHKKSRRVDQESCIGCRTCASVCPVDVLDEYSGGMGTRKAAHLPFEGCLPHVSVIDSEYCLRFAGGSCEACAEACPFGSIRLAEEDEEMDILCGALVLATGCTNVPAPNADSEADILDCFQMERMLHPNGPTGGQVLRKNGRPPLSILFALSEDGCRDGLLGWMEIIKLAERVRHVLPGVRMILAGGTGWNLGPGSDLMNGLEAADADFVPAWLTGVTASSENGTLSATLQDGVAFFQRPAEMVVIWTKSAPARGAEHLGRLLRIRTRPDSFFEDRAGPFETAFSGVAGICVAGCAGGPKTVAASIQDGAVAAARILSRLVPGEKIQIEPLASEVDGALCSGCGVCRSSCPFSAIAHDGEDGTSRIVAALCRGCGTCAAACPSGAIKARHFTSEQLAAEIEGLLILDPKIGGGPWNPVA